MSVEHRVSRRLHPVPARLPVGAADRPEAQRALVVDGNADAGDATSVALLAAGFEVSVAPSGASALQTLAQGGVDLIVVDALLPDCAGIDLLREIRARDDVPVVMLGARESDAERILGLELGADDYVTKPFSPPELASRARAILRRLRREQGTAPPLRTVGSLRIDEARHEVTLDGRPVTVTASEFRLLALLAASPGRVFTRRQIMEHLWSGPYFGDGHPVDTHVLNLRRKLEVESGRPSRLLTVRGIGFKLVAPGCEAGAA
jgi:DNA-binding response OmpR family regulator